MCSKKILFPLLVVLMNYNFSFGQQVKSYSSLIGEAWKLYGAKEYSKSAQKYIEAFTLNGNKGTINDRYNAACSYSLSNQIDSSFVHLFKIAQKGNYSNYSHITNDPDLNLLHNDRRWNELLQIIKSNKERMEAHWDRPLVHTLDSIFEEDQKYRWQIGEVEKKYGRESVEMKELWKVINQKDSSNLIKVQKILDERGWLGPDVVGPKGNQTLFLVIQHTPDITVQEKYLPMMREAVKKEKARASDLALLEDRVALKQGKRQIYGSQIGMDQTTGKYYVSPLEDPENVDRRREEVGLGSLQEYVSNWGITWNVEEYKKSLPQLEVKEKIKRGL